MAKKKPNPAEANTGRILAIDPGNVQSAFVLLSLVDRRPLNFGKIDNWELRASLANGDIPSFGTLVSEFPRPRGQLASKELFDTAAWIGVFEEVVRSNRPTVEIERMDRKDVKMTLCEHPRAKDPQIRQALIDLYGGETVAIGGKKCSKCKGKGWFGAGRPTCDQCKGKKWDQPPGPLNGISQDVWQALGVGVTWIEIRKLKA